MTNKQTLTKLWQHTIAPSLSLFTSLGTLLCCALPALLVTLGMGVTLAGIVATMPWLVALSEHKVYVFIGAAIMLLISGLLQYRSRNISCPADIRKAKACARLSKIGRVTWWLALLLYLIGFFFAFIAVHIFY
jgi:hypothetical protein